MSKTADTASEGVRDRLLGHTAVVVSSFVAGNQVPASEMPTLVKAVYGTLASLASGVAVNETHGQKPAVPKNKSVTDEYMVCLEDGKKLTMLKRYLWTHYKMTPEQYRKKWDLPHDYPMVAPRYAKLRSAFAKKIGLGKIPIPGRGQRKK